MTREQLKELVHNLTVQRQSMMFDQKQKVYTGKLNDAHGNFKRRSQALHISVEKVIEADMWKHWDTIQYGNLAIDSDGGLESRFADFLNYAELYYAYLVDQRDAAKRP